jgi:hypothetical protein
MWLFFIKGEEMKYNEKAKLLLLGHNYRGLLGRVIGLLNDLNDNCEIPEELQVRMGDVEQNIDDVLNGEFKDNQRDTVQILDLEPNTRASRSGYKLYIFDDGSMDIINESGGSEVLREEIEVRLK